MLAPLTIFSLPTLGLSYVGHRMSEHNDEILGGLLSWFAAETEEEQFAPRFIEASIVVLATRFRAALVRRESAGGDSSMDDELRSWLPHAADWEPGSSLVTC